MNPKITRTEWVLIALNLGIYLGAVFYMAEKAGI